MSGWKTVAGAACASFTEKKSEFIGHISPVTTEEEAIAFVNAIRKQYADAKHNVYAYILRENNTMRFSDDGEPHGTAGMPVLDVLRKAGITDCAVVVTRYFGGILLGTGGLVRAYTQGAKMALEQAGIAELVELTAFSVKVGYSDHGKVEPLLTLSGVKNMTAEFGADVILHGAIKKEDFAALSEKLTEATNGRAIVSEDGVTFGAV